MNNNDIYQKFKLWTMVPEIHYLHSLTLADHIRDIPGSIVECGVWMGGQIAGIATVLGPDREYVLYDSFQGIPDVDITRDGQWCADWVATQGVCFAEEHHCRTAMHHAEATNVHVVPGWFNETLPHAHFDNGIALLRMDADLYSSTLDILTWLFPQVNPGGMIIIDDYLFLEGCSKAVHTYLSDHDRPEKLATIGNQLIDHGVTYMIKRSV